MAKILKFIISIAVCLAAAFLGSLATMPAIPEWYASLKKPSFNPPNWIFGPAWTLLYALMAIAAYLVWKEGWEKREVRTALTVFGIQLALNVFWSFLFFKFQSPAKALMEILVLWLAIFLTILSFMKVSRPAGWLLVPYLLWVSFATVLNFFIVRFNP